MAAFLFTGMTIFLIISTLYPNGLDLRPVQFERDNIFVDMVKMLYKADTPTNVLPSIHVFNSIGVCIAISHNRVLSRRKVIHYGSLVLGISIILVTMFLKQHSVIDVTLSCDTALSGRICQRIEEILSRKGTQTIYKESCRRLIYKHRPDHV